jgi:hypothetical protein
MNTLLSQGPKGTDEDVTIPLWPFELSPMHLIEPSASIAHKKLEPASMLTAFDSEVGTREVWISPVAEICLFELSPQQKLVPAEDRAHAN